MPRRGKPFVNLSSVRIFNDSCRWRKETFFSFHVNKGILLVTRRKYFTFAPFFRSISVIAFPIPIATPVTIAILLYRAISICAASNCCFAETLTGTGKVTWKKKEEQNTGPGKTKHVVAARLTRLLPAPSSYALQPLT